MVEMSYVEHTNKYFLDRNLYLYINHKLNGMTQKELGKKVGLSKGRVGNIIRDIDKRLEKYEKYLFSSLFIDNKLMLFTRYREDATYTSS